MKEIFYLMALLVLIFLSGCKENDNNPVDIHEQEMVPGIITGEVKDGMTEIPAVQAQISTIPETKLVYSNEEGKFLIEDVKPGKYRIVCYKEGMDTTSFEISVAEGQTVTLELKLYSKNSSVGKLPFPHQRPNISVNEYRELLNDLWIINNYGLYQGGDTRNSVYYHNGIDIVLDNGTQIYAIEKGYVRKVFEFGEFYSMAVVEDFDEPNNAWLYVHVYDFSVKDGDLIEQGTPIATVNFQGLPHIHLVRLFIEDGTSWEDWRAYKCVNPDKYFEYIDNEAPTFDTTLYFFRNQTDNIIAKGNSQVISGDVDIVVGIRDGGKYAHSESSKFGDRLCVAKIEYEISGAGISTIYKKSFDFTKMIFERIRSDNDRIGYINLVYKFIYDIHPQGPPSWHKVFSYYVITNTDGSGNTYFLEDSMDDFSLKTSELPNGEYVITVHAYDSNGNKSSFNNNFIISN